MLFDFNFYSSLLLIFFVHGLVYALLMFRKGIVNDTVADKWLGFFLLLCILFVAPWMIGFAGWYDTQPYRDILFYVPFQHLYFIGPVVFFYVQSLLNPLFTFTKKDAWHFLPGILYLLFSVVMFVTDKLVLKQYYFLANGEDPDFDAWYQWTGFASMFFYFLLSLRYYKLYRKMIVQMVSYADVVLFRWVKNFLSAFLLMLLLRFVFNIIFLLMPAFGNYVGVWWFYISFALLFYYIAITGYANTAIATVAFKVQHLIAYQPKLLLHYKAPILLEKENDTIEDADFIEIASETNNISLDEAFPLTTWKEQIENLFVNEKIYEDQTLGLTDLSKKLKTNPSILSKIINQGFDLNFNDFVNRYRVEAVKKKLIAGEQKSQTLLGIAYDCGFNSKATFNRAFKKVTGVSPKDWQADNESK